MHTDFHKTSRPAGFFITGTDTDVGKTYAAGCIGLTLTQQQIAVSPRKPIASGCILQPDGSLLSEDALFLQQSCSPSESLDAICPHTYQPAISPQRALAQAQAELTTADLARACQVAAGRFPMVEGAGGFYSPLASDGLNRDLAVALNYPVIVVVGNQLGCINHTLLTLAAIEQAGLKVHSVIVNDVTAEADIDNYHDIKAMLSTENYNCYHLSYSPKQQAHTIPDFTL